MTKDRLYFGTGAVANVGDHGFELTFTGLNSAISYDLTAYTGPKTGDATWSIATGTGSAMAYVQNDTAMDNIFDWAGITPDASGTIVLNGISSSDKKWQSVALSGVTLTAIPEPATFGLMGLAGVGLLLARRRFKD